MSTTQKVSLLTGASGSSYVGFTPAIGSLCIPAMNLEDGPAGVGDGMTTATQLPAPVDAAATWDTSAEQLHGQVIGSEQAAKGTTTANGTLVNLYSCNGSAAQAWQPQSNGSLLNPQSGKCLDDTGFSATPGTQVQIWSCTGAANQAWTLP
jgi:beta-glucosidase